MLFKKKISNLSAKSKANTTVVLAPSGGVFVGVGPQKVAEQPLVRNVSRPHDPPDLFHRLKVGR